MSARTSANNPFPGLRPFETEEYKLFFGREGQSDELLARLECSHFLAVVGTSGSGKSSLIRAGLMPALHGGMMKGTGAGWRIAVMRPGGDPIGNLATELVKKGVLVEAGVGLPEYEAEAVIEATLRSGSLGIVNVARQARLSVQEKLLIVVDQFEELFRFRAAHERSSADEASAFVKLLLEASRQRALAIYVVLTMRSDFLGDCAQFQGLPEAINDGQYLIPRMTRDERRFAVTGPVGVTRGKITEPLVNRLLNDVGDNPDQLPILQHALMRTWDYWQTRRRDGEPIGIEHYEAIGTMADALSRHADEAFHELPNQRSRRIAEVLFKTLCERAADNREVRRPTRLDTICKIADASMEEVVAVIDVFRKSGRSFLMPPVGTDLHAASVIDISHESLIRNWQRLKEWVNEEVQSVRIYRRLADAAVLHREGTEGLLQDPALQFALDWREKSRPNAAWGRHYHPEFDAAIAYLDKSSAARDERIAAEQIRRNEGIARDKRELEQAKLFASQQARSARRMKWLIVALCLILLLAIGTAGYAFNLRADADNSRRIAEESKRIADDEKQKAIAYAAQLNEAKDDLEIQIRAARESEDRALKSEIATAVQKRKAEAAARLANQKTIEALNNLRAVNAAKIEANTRAEELALALERGELIRDGLEAAQRDDLAMARDVFYKLRGKLTPFQPKETGGQNPTAEHPQRLVYDYGWTLSRLAEAHQKLGDHEKAIEIYENALKVFEFALKSPSEPILFQTYHGLARAYHNNAKFQAYEVRPATRLNLSPDQQFSRAEEYYKKAVGYYDQFRLEKPLYAVPSLKDLAQLYMDRDKYVEAEERLKSVVQLYKDIKDSDVGPQGTKTALKELAEFYRSRGMFQDSARTYNELLDLQEAEGVSVEDARGLRELADNYSELGQVYKALNDARSDSAFQLVEKLQEVILKVKHQDAADFESKDRTALANDLDAIGDLYLRLERFKEARETYETALVFREEDSSRATGHLKLANLHKNIKDYPTAETYYTQLIKERKDAKGPLGSGQPLSQYLEGLRQLGIIYAEHMNRPAEAESLFEEALTALAKVGRPASAAWDEEEKVYSALLSLYRRDPEKIEATTIRRYETMSRRAGLMVVERRTAAYRRFMVPFVKTTAEIGDLYLRRQDKARAEKIFRTMFELGSLVSLLREPAQLDDYVKSLQNYKLLIKDSRPADVASIDKVIDAARTRKTELERENESATSDAQQSAPRQ